MAVPSLSGENSFHCLGDWYGHTYSSKARFAPVLHLLETVEGLQVWLNGGKPDVGRNAIVPGCFLELC